MAIEPYDEHEQSERVLDWLRRNGLGLVLGVVVGLGLIGGWRWWQTHQHGQRIEAGMQYQAVLDGIGAGDLDRAGSAADGLRSGSYGALAALDLAKAQFEAGDQAAAIATLRAADSSDPALEAIRRQRLAQLLIEAGEADEAVGLLAGSEDPVGLESLGDAHYALERRDEAMQSYEAALRRLDATAPQRRLLELKLIDVGGTPAQHEAI